MNILIDADGCPVVDLTLQIAKQFGIPVIILCDTSHQIECEGAQTLVFDKGADSVDFALVNRVKPGDLVVTQDYGLASMCLARCARVLNQNGLEYTADNMEGYLKTSDSGCQKKLLGSEGFQGAFLLPGEHPGGFTSQTLSNRLVRVEAKASSCAFVRFALPLGCFPARRSFLFSYRRSMPETQFLKELPEGLPLKGGPIHLIQLFR